MAASCAFTRHDEESPDSTGSGRRVTPGGSDPIASATESRPPMDLGRQASVTGKGETVV